MGEAGGGVQGGGRRVPYRLPRRAPPLPRNRPPREGPERNPRGGGRIHAVEWYPPHSEDHQSSRIGRPGPFEPLHPCPGSRSREDSRGGFLVRRGAGEGGGGEDRGKLYRSPHRAGVPPGVERRGNPPNHRLCPEDRGREEVAAPWHPEVRALPVR